MAHDLTATVIGFSGTGLLLLAFVLTALAVYVYSRSWVLTVLPLACSLASVVWQFGSAPVVELVCHEPGHYQTGEVLTVLVEP